MRVLMNCGRRGSRLFATKAAPPCPSKVSHPCPHPTPAPAGAKAPIVRDKVPRGFELQVNSKKCPVFCSYGEKQCPPLVPPVVRAKRSPTKVRDEGITEVPTAALLAYRLVVFGAKVGIGAYCIKWTLDNHIWGHSSDTRALWDQWKNNVHTAVPALTNLSGAGVDPCSRTSVAQVWNQGVMLTFDRAQEAGRALRRFAVDKERAAYGVGAAGPHEGKAAEDGFWQALTRRWFEQKKGVPPPPPPTTAPVASEKEEAAFVETVAPGECHLAAVITEPANQDIHRLDGEPLPEEAVAEPPAAPEVEELEEFEAAVEKRVREEGEVRAFCCQLHQQPSEDDLGRPLKSAAPCGKPECTVCPTLVVTVDK